MIKIFITKGFIITESKTQLKESNNRHENKYHFVNYRIVKNKCAVYFQSGETLKEI